MKQCKQSYERGFFLQAHRLISVWPRFGPTERQGTSLELFSCSETGVTMSCDMVTQGHTVTHQARHREALKKTTPIQPKPKVAKEKTSPSTVKREYVS